MIESIKMTENRVDEKWLGDVLADNAARALSHNPLTDELGAACIRFVDSVINDRKYNYWRFDKAIKAEICSCAYAKICSKIGNYEAGKGKPSNWLYTMAKNVVSDAADIAVAEERNSEIVQIVIGNEILTKLDGIDTNAPMNQVLNERITALSDFRLNGVAKERIFRQSMYLMPSLRNKKSLVRRARNHNKMSALKVAENALCLTAKQNNELSKLLEARHHG